MILDGDKVLLGHRAKDKEDEWCWFPLDALPERVYTPSEKFLKNYIASQK